MIERVRRPSVASISLPVFFASSRSRFIGAEPGVTIATTFDAATTFPNPILTSTGLKSPFFIFILLKILSDNISTLLAQQGICSILSFRLGRNLSLYSAS
jgi:hypothetical protein